MQFVVFIDVNLPLSPEVPINQEKRVRETMLA
jgi:hypothetical protein